MCMFSISCFINLVGLFKLKVNNGKLKEDDARRYFHQLINAVDYCHSRGVFHRDLKVLLHTVSDYAFLDNLRAFEMDMCMHFLTRGAHFAA